jgi:hypothetical protein
VEADLDAEGAGKRVVAMVAAAGARAVQVVLEGDHDELLERFRSRIGERHAGHGDDHLVDEVAVARALRPPRPARRHHHGRHHRPWRR